MNNIMELEIFIEIFEHGLTDDLLKNLSNELNNVVSISELKEFIEKCMEHKTVREFRNCVLNKIKKALELKEINAKKLIDEQKNRMIPTQDHAGIQPLKRNR